MKKEMKGMREERFEMVKGGQRELEEKDVDVVENEGRLFDWG